MAEVSIIVPVYNTEKYLRNTLDALCSQTLKDIEIILVDDGSTDFSGKICDEYAEKDGRVKAVHTENQGVSAARNTGLELASGEYIGFFDSDDLPDGDMYESLLALAKKTGCDIALTVPLVVYNDGKTHTRAKNGGELFYNDRQDILRRFLSNEFGSGAHRLLVRSQLAKAVRFDTSLKINEDKLYMFEIMRRADSVGYLDEVKYKYFRRNGSLSFSRFSSKYFDGLTVAEKINDIIRRDYPALADNALAALAVSHLWLLKIMYLENGLDENRERWEKSVEFLRGLGASFCKKHLSRNDYIKWLSLKIGTPLFKIMTRLFSRN